MGNHAGDASVIQNKPLFFTPTWHSIAYYSNLLAEGLFMNMDKNLTDWEVFARPGRVAVVVHINGEVEYSWNIARCEFNDAFEYSLAEKLEDNIRETLNNLESNVPSSAPDNWLAHAVSYLFYMKGSWNNLICHSIILTLIRRDAKWKNIEHTSPDVVGINLSIEGSMMNTEVKAERVMCGAA
jgi:hypothetical protein